ncbi:MAG: SH3 domain-containing protein [Deltaproteobacteria bacterium]
MIKPLQALLFAAPVAAGLLVPLPFANSAQAAANYGCFQVVTPSLNIRERPYSDARVIGTASAGEILEKRKRWCTLRGYWCAVRKGTLEGYADKSFLSAVKCP